MRRSLDGSCCNQHVHDGKEAKKGEVWWCNSVLLLKWKHADMHSKIVQYCVQHDTGTTGRPAAGGGGLVMTVVGFGRVGLSA